MKLGIMQPYFFPYIGYFQLINCVDEFILLDTVQFIRHGWIERNRILKQDRGWLYVKVPLKKHSRKILIKNIEIKEENWQAKIFAQLKHYKKRAPFYNNVIRLLIQIFDNNCLTITQLNFLALKSVCSYLKIETPIHIFSKMSIEIDEVTDSGEWALNISKAMNADTYINPIGGKEIFDKRKFKSNNITLRFLESNEIKYNQKREPFESWLSIIDVMMFNSPDEINKLLNEYRLLV